MARCDRAPHRTTLRCHHNGRSILRPQLGRFLQPDPISGGSANAYSYTFGDPRQQHRPNRRLHQHSVNRQPSNRGPRRPSSSGREKGRNTTGSNGSRGKTRSRNRCTRCRSGSCRSWPAYRLGRILEEFEEWGEEEDEYVYISDLQGAGLRHRETHVEPTILVQSLDDEAGQGEEATTLGSAVPLCKAGFEGPCARPTRGGEGTHKVHYYHYRVVPSGSVCCGISTATTLAGPEFSVPRWIGYAIFGACGG